MPASLYDLSPLLHMLVVGALLASGPVLWVVLRHGRGEEQGRYQALVWVTLLLTFDLVLFGAFTRLTDSGLGCPDWPGCYGNASPLGAHADIAAAQAALPSGPVTHGKAWVEMVHRYLAMGVGGLIVVLTVSAWLGLDGLRTSTQNAPAPCTAPRRLNPWWPTATLVWVGVQGAFGALTVTMKLFPAIVSLHLLGGYGLLALLTVQVVRMGPAVRPLSATSDARASSQVRVPAHFKAWMLLGLAMLLVQVTSGAWVSTNYAVLACTEFPQCQGSWWPAMDFAQGFTVWHPLGALADGTSISLAALTAIHFVHRGLAVLTVLLLGLLAYRAQAHMLLRRASHWLAGLLLLQLITGLSNVVLGWPLLAALLHTGGAGALVVVLTWLLTLACVTPHCSTTPSTTLKQL
jgi:cytochrome c oxidase assembly protein subunit 15